MLMMLAEATPTLTDVLGPAAGAVGGAGFAGIIAIVLLKYTIPNLTNAFRDESQANRVEFRNALKEQCEASERDFTAQRADFRQMQSEQRTDFKTWMDASICKFSHKE